MRRKKPIVYALTAAMILSCSGYAADGTQIVKASTVDDQLGAQDNTFPASYNTGFKINKETIYNVNVSTSVLILGSFNCYYGCSLNDIYYQGKKLEKNVDYTLSSQAIKLSDKILSNLPFGENEFTVYANYNQDEKNVATTITVNKVDYEMPDTYVPEYPLSETKNFNTTMCVNKNERCELSSFIFEMKQMKEFNQVFLDHKRVPTIADTGAPTGLRQYYSQSFNEDGGALFHIVGDVFNGCETGIHYLEVVRDGISEVLTVILYDDDTSALEILEDAKKTTQSTHKKTYFSMTQNLYYNVGASKNLLIGGHYEGLSYITYEGRRLEENVDYVVDPVCLKFSDEILDELKSGYNEFTVYAKEYEDSYNVPFKVVIQKMDYQIPDTYVPKYPLTNEKNFYTTMAVSSLKSDTINCFYGLKELKEYDELYIDHERIPFLMPSEAPAGLREFFDEPSDVLGGGFFILNCITIKNMTPGIHYVEAVRDGKSEVLSLILYDDENTPQNILYQASRQVSNVHLNVDVTSNVANGVSQRYTVSQTDSKQALQLDKLKIRYYYSKDGKKAQSFACDNAGITLNKAPYYMDCTKMVNGEFGEGYVEIGFNDSYNLANDTLQLGVRFNQNDWSAYENFEENAVEVYYDGKLIYQKK